MQNSNEKSKCCKECNTWNIPHAFLYCNNSDCNCHKPSVEVSKCCGVEKKPIVADEGTAYYACSNCGKEFEPQSIPLDRDEREKYLGSRCENHPDFFPDECGCSNKPLQNTEMEEWETIEKDFKELFYEGERNSTYCKKHKCYATPHEIKEFARYESQKLVSEYKQFILNILDGIDKADEEMGNKGGGTKAIRLTIESRII